MISVELYTQLTHGLWTHSDCFFFYFYSKPASSTCRPVPSSGDGCAVMPQLSATAVLQLVLLLSALPAQYFISRWSGSTAAQRYHATTR